MSCRAAGMNVLRFVGQALSVVVSATTKWQLGSRSSSRAGVLSPTDDCCLPFRRHVAVDELRHNSVHRVQRHPPGLGRAHIADTIPNAGQRRHRSVVARPTHDQSGVQRGDGGDVTSQSQAVADVDDVRADAYQFLY